MFLNTVIFLVVFLMPPILFFADIIKAKLAEFDRYNPKSSEGIETTDGCTVFVDTYADGRRTLRLEDGRSILWEDVEHDEKLSR